MGETVIGEFEARRVERMLRGLYVAWLRDDETLQVSGERDGDWLCVCWRLADASGRFVYPVEARVDLRAQRLRLREAVDLLKDVWRRRVPKQPPTRYQVRRVDRDVQRRQVLILDLAPVVVRQIRERDEVRGEE